MTRSTTTPIQKRFSDLDPFHHVNNVAQQAYFDTGKTDYFEQMIGPDVLLGDLRLVTASTTTSYLGQVRPNDPVKVTTECEHIGNKSLTLHQQLLVGNEVRAESRTVLVAFDFAAQQSRPVPDNWRARMAPEK